MQDGNVVKNSADKLNSSTSSPPTTSTTPAAAASTAAVAAANRKERSVLQAKLTKLAIQIGYAGTCAAVLQ